MNMLEILNNDPKTMSSNDKLEKVGVIIASARKAYGNEGVSIESPDIETINGLSPLVHLSSDAKVGLAISVLNEIKMEAVEATRRQEGVNINKKIEELIATSDILVNISTVVEYDYI